MLFSVMSYKDNRAASKNSVELLGQVTPASASLLKSVAGRIDAIGDFQVGYKTISLDHIEAAGGLTENNIGKVILFSGDDDDDAEKK